MILCQNRRVCFRERRRTNEEEIRKKHDRSLHLQTIASDYHNYLMTLETNKIHDWIDKIEGGFLVLKYKSTNEITTSLCKPYE